MAPAQSGSEIIVDHGGDLLRLFLTEETGTN